DAAQISAEIALHDHIEASLSVLEMLYACRQVQALEQGLETMMARWAHDARALDLSERLARLRQFKSFALAPEARAQQFGVLEYSYRGFDHFERDIQERGVYTVNLGDFIQSEAVRLA